MNCIIDLQTHGQCLTFRDIQFYKETFLTIEKIGKIQVWIPLATFSTKAPNRKPVSALILFLSLFPSRLDLFLNNCLFDIFSGAALDKDSQIRVWVCRNP